MGKIFITDEVNDGRTARVTKSGALTINPSNNSYQLLASAVGSATSAIYASACWLHTVTIGGFPASATQLILLNASAASATATASTDEVARITIPVKSGGVCADTGAFPKTLLFDLYCSKGLYYEVGNHISAAASAWSGALGGITVTYRT